MEEKTVVNNKTKQPNIPTSPQPKHRSFLTNKLFLITLAIVVLFTIVYAGIYLYLGSQLYQISKPNQAPITTQPSPAPDETANWKTYANKSYSYSFDYPSDWEINEKTVHRIVITDRILKKGLLVVVLGVDTKENYKDIQDWFTRITEDKNSIDKVVETKKISLDGEIGYLTKYESSLVNAESIFYNAIVIHNGTSLQLVFTHIDKIIFDQILSTFKFTN